MFFSSPFAHFTFLPALFHDDIFVPIVSDSAKDAPLDASAVLSRAHICFATFGLLINFSPGKTESILLLHGPGAKEVNKYMQSIDNSLNISLAPLLPDKFVLVRFVTSYKHMGTTYSHTLSSEV